MFIVNTEAAIYKDGRYLLCKRSEAEDHAPGGLALVGGKVELERASSDILERTIAREVAALYWMTPEEVYGNPDAADYLKDYIRKAEDVRLSGVSV